MKGYQNILVPIDFAENEEAILAEALRVLATGGKLTMLHVVEYMPAVTQGTFGIYPHRKDIDKIKELSMAKLREILRQHEDENLTPLVREGKPAHLIVETIGEIEPDLVVMGTRGRSKLDHLLIGSVTERVIRQAPCAVLTVRV